MSTIESRRKARQAKHAKSERIAKRAASRNRSLAAQGVVQEQIKQAEQKRKSERIAQRAIERNPSLAKQGVVQRQLERQKAQTRQPTQISQAQRQAIQRQQEPLSTPAPSSSSTANMSTEQGAVYSPAPSTPRRGITPAEIRAAKAQGQLQSISPLPSFLNKEIAARSVPKKVSSIAGQEAEQLSRDKARTAVALTAGLTVGGTVGAVVASTGATGLTAGALNVGATAGAFKGLNEARKAYSNITTDADIRDVVGEARKRQRQVELSQGQTFAESVNPRLKRPQLEALGKSEAINVMVEYGFTPEQVRRGVRELDRRDRIESFQKITTDIAIVERLGEGIGRSSAAQAFKDVALKKGKTTALKGALISAPPLAVAGFAEGSSDVFTTSVAADVPVDYKQVIKGGLFGAAVAPAIGAPLVGLDIATKTATKKATRVAASRTGKVLRGAVEFAETGKEFLGDLSQDIAERSIRVPVVVPSVSIVGTTTTKTKAASTVKTTASSRVRSSSRSEVRIPLNPNVPVITKVEADSFPIKPPTDIKPKPRNDVKPEIDDRVEIKIPLEAKVEVPVPVKSDVRINVPINTVVSDKFIPPLIPIVEPSDGGAGAFKFKLPKRTRTRGGFLPSLAGLESGLTQKSAPSISSGIGLRLPVANTRLFDKRAERLFSSAPNLFKKTKPSTTKKKKKRKKKK